MKTICNNIKNSFRASFRNGMFYGVLDIIFRLISLILWILTVKLLLTFMWEAVFVLKINSERIWWLVYSSMSLVMVTLLAYTAVYDRE
ncbi:MAG: hypothetical protein II726_00770, partial [Elusimicrobiaceae bacterium]|nr:hypothetical protein [Elusimicrobiaceae bacterium]